MLFLYLVILAGLAVFYVLYVDSLALIMLLAALALPVLMLVMLIWLRLSTHCSLRCQASMCRAGNSVPVEVICESRCPLSFPKALAVVKVRHTLGSTSETIRLRFPLHGRNSTRLTFYVRAEQCGIVEMQLVSLHVPDPLHLFRMPIKCTSARQESLTVLPNPLPTALADNAAPVWEPESDRYGDRPGDDPAELFGIREYAPGDQVSRIHWKLSARSDQLYLKEFGYPVEKRVLLLAEQLWSPYQPLSERLQSSSTLLTAVYSAAAGLLGKRYTLILGWHDERSARLMTRLIGTHRELDEAFRDMYGSLDAMNLDAQELRQTFAEPLSSVTLVTNKENPEVLHVMEINLDAQQKNLLFVTPKGDLPFRSDTVALYALDPAHPVMPELSV